MITQPQSAISTGTIPDLHRHCRFSPRMSFSNDPLLCKWTSTLSTFEQAHVFTRNGSSTWILTSTSTKSFVKHVARLVHSVFQITQLVHSVFRIGRGTFSCLPDSPRNSSPDQICVVTSPKHVFARHGFLVLRHFQGHMVESILGHGDKDPAILLEILKSGNIY